MTDSTLVTVDDAFAALISAIGDVERDKPLHPICMYLLATRDKKDTSSEEVHRLRRQLKKSKESRRVIVEQHDEAINRLERAKEVFWFKSRHCCAAGSNPRALDRK